MFGFLFSWFLDQPGPKICCTKTESLPNLFFFAPLGNHTNGKLLGRSEAVPSGRNYNMYVTFLEACAVSDEDSGDGVVSRRGPRAADRAHDRPPRLQQRWGEEARLRLPLHCIWGGWGGTKLYIICASISVTNSSSIQSTFSMKCNYVHVNWFEWKRNQFGWFVVGELRLINIYEAHLVNQGD